MNDFDISRVTVKLDNLLSPETIQKALNNACIAVENKAKEHCPVDTGQLRRSITHEVIGTTGYVGTNVEYAPYVEYGTWKMNPQPFLHPALTESRSTIEEIFVDAIKRS